MTASSAWRLSLLAAGLFTWAHTWGHLALFWEAYPQYAYGPAVPVLFLILSVRAAWIHQTQPVRSSQGSKQQGFRIGPLTLSVTAGLLWITGLLIQRADPLWRMGGTVLALAASFFSAAGWLAFGGGMMLGAQLHPLLYMWSAVPWPMAFDNGIAQSLQAGIAKATTFVATIANVPVFQHGTMLQLASGSVGVDEACSGVQSLQGSVMAGPFLIAYHQGRLSFLRELLLIGSSVVVALAMNFLRIVTLVYMTHTGGTTTAAQNHDIIGIIATTFTFGGIWLIAQLLLRNSAPTGAPTQGTQLTLPSQQQLAVTVTAVALFPWLAIQLLFPTDQAASNRKPRVTPWRIDLSTLPDRWSVRKTEPRVSERALLRFSDAAIYHLTTDTGIHAVLYHFEWQTQRMPARAFRHTPALCMPWAGWTPTALPLAVELPVANVRSPAVAHFFRRGTERVGALQLVASNGGARLQMDATSTLTRT